MAGHRSKLNIVFFLTLLLHSTYCMEQPKDNSNDFIHLLQQSKLGLGNCVAIVEEGYNPQEFDPRKVEFCANIDSAEISNETNIIVEGLRKKIQPFLSSSKNDIEILSHDTMNIMITEGDLRVSISTKFDNFCGDPYFSYSMTLYFLLDEELNPGLALQGSFSTSDLYLDALSESSVSLLAYIPQMLSDVSQKKYEDSKKHATDVIQTFQSIAPQATVKVYKVNQLMDIAQNPDVKIVSISTSSLINVKKSLFLGSFYGCTDLTYYEQLYEDYIETTYSCFKDTGKLLVIALDNQHKEFTQCNFNQALLRLAKYAEKNGFYVLLVGAVATGNDNIFGPMSFLTENTLNLEDIMQHFVTAPGFMIPLHNKILNGTSFATPIVAGGLINMLSDLPAKTSVDLIKKAIIKTGRKKVAGYEFKPNRDERESFIKEFLGIYPELVPPQMHVNFENLDMDDVNFDRVYNATLHHAIQSLEDALNTSTIDAFEKKFWSNLIIRKFLFNHFELNLIKKVFNHVDISEAMNYILSGNEIHQGKMGCY